MSDEAIPSGWRLVKLGDLGEVNRGRSRHRPRYAEHLYGGPYPFIQTGDIKNSGGRITKYHQTYSEAGLAQSRLWPAGTMCITIAANIAETGILTFPACFPDSVIGFIADESKCNVYFVEYMFRYLKGRIQYEASGSVQDNINLETLDRLRFPLPPLPEQRAISNILGTLDDRIDLNRRMNETLEAIARSIFKSWFVDFDPVHAKMEGRNPYLPKPIADLFPDRFEKGVLRDIPAEWKVGTLGDIAALVKEPINPLDNPDEEFLHFSIPAFDEGQEPKEEVGAAIRSLKFTVPSDVVLLSKLNPEIERVWLVDVGTLDRAVCSTEFLVLRAKPPFSCFYLYCLARSPEFRSEIEGLVTGTSKSHQRAQVEAVLDLVALLPHPTTVKAFESVAALLLERTLANKREIRILTALRDTLLPKLIFGELRVQDAGRFIGRQT